MEDRKITAKTEEEFIRTVALDCVAHMKESTRKKMCDHPYTLDYHFVYADQRFHDDYELAKIALSDNHEINLIFPCLSDRLKDDLSLALMDASLEYPNVKYYSARLRDREEVAETFIGVHGIQHPNFQYMNDRIKQKYRTLEP